MTIFEAYNDCKKQLEKAGIEDYEKAKALLLEYGKVREAVEAYKASL